MAATLGPDRNSPWREIDALLDEVAQLSRTCVQPREFHAEVLSRSIRALGAAAGLVWIGSSPSALALDVHADSTPELATQKLIQSDAHRTLIQSIAQSHVAQIVMPRMTLATAGESPNPTDLVLVTVPLTQDDFPDACGVFEILQPYVDSPGVQQAALTFLKAISELIGEYHRHRQYRLLQNRVNRHTAFEDFVTRIHRGLDLKTTAFEIANEGRRLANCDRLTVVHCDGRNTCEVLAISGVESIDPRANAIHQLQELARLAVDSGETHEFGGSTLEANPEARAACLEYCRKTNARKLAVVPLKRAVSSSDSVPGADSIGVLIGEQFGELESEFGLGTRIEAMAPHAASALSNALDHQNLPLLSILQGLQRIRRLSWVRNRPRVVWGMILSVITISALILVPADFDVVGTGTLQPQKRRGVFARSDGIVSDVRADHGQRCAQGDILAVLARPQLELETVRVAGELQTARRKLESIQAARLENTEESPQAREKYHQLTAEEEEVKALVQSLQQQRELMAQQQDELTVRNPLAGQVLTWNVREVLESRPVARGDLLMTVADVDGPWVLEIRVPDDQIGYVLDARQLLQRDPGVSFLLSTEPGPTYQGTVQEVGMSVENNEEGDYVLITVTIDKDQIPRLRPGATVIPRIHCGRRSLGFVWFHGLWNAIRTRLLF